MWRTASRPKYLSHGTNHTRRLDGPQGQTEYSLEKKTSARTWNRTTIPRSPSPQSSQTVEQEALGWV